MPPLPRIPLLWEALSAEEKARRAREVFARFCRRRSVRDFAARPVARELVESAIRIAATAPSGANRQPWHFVAVADPEVKRRIRVAAEAEEKASYEGRMSAEWLSALEPLGTDWRKPFLETAPWLVVVFAEIWEERPDGARGKNYYVRESVGIACGFFIAALHEMGLATLTHTPSPMGFLNDILGRPPNEKPFILFPVGIPADGCTVPDLDKKPLDAIVTWLEPGTGRTG
jgi:iodotyrosine deiodinase